MARENEAGESRAEVKAKRDVQFWLDVVMKLTVPVGAIVAAWLANHFEQNRANLQLINQREQAESSLRATMFGQLIAPIAGPEGGADLDPIRYAVLAELMTLNFHEHFELKPLLQDADDRLAAYKGTAATSEAIVEARSDLRAAAHRVIQRQIAQLWDDEIAQCAPASSMETTFQFVSDPELEESFGSTDATTLLVPSKELKTFVVSSPDCRDKLSIVFAQPDFSSERVHVLITPASSTTADADYRFDFDLTSFAFPFTDNALLPDGNRFAFFVKDVSQLDESVKIMRVGLRWFPQNYYPPTERPTDYKEFRKALGSSAE